MEKFKIDLFLKESAGAPFPQYDTLSARECKTVFIRLLEKIGLPVESTGLELVSGLYNQQRTFEEINAEDEDFSLAELLDATNIGPQKYIFVNWYQFDNIDKLTLQDLSDCFQDIWYPGSDDIDVFDLSLSWVLSIRHDGAIRFVEFSTV